MRFFVAAFVAIFDWSRRRVDIVRALVWSSAPGVPHFPNNGTGGFSCDPVIGSRSRPERHPKIMILNDLPLASSHAAGAHPTFADSSARVLRDESEFMVYPDSAANAGGDAPSLLEELLR